MNERIKELAKQAASIEGWGPEVWQTTFSEKFAELIMLECIKVCNSRVGNSDYTTGRMHCASDLREHFGVGE